MTFLKYLNPIYWIYGDYSIEDTIICINSYSPTQKRFNYVVTKHEHDDSDERIVKNTLLEPEEYLNNINK
jgi:hypothetical protein